MESRAGQYFATMVSAVHSVVLNPYLRVTMRPSGGKILLMEASTAQLLLTMVLFMHLAMFSRDFFVTVRRGGSNIPFLESFILNHKRISLL